MKKPKINEVQPTMANARVLRVTPQSDPPLERHVHTITLRIGGKRYETSWYSEIREITKGPAQVIEMPGPRPDKG